jgi:hypothetical protein
MLRDYEIQRIRSVLAHLVGRWADEKDKHSEIAKEIVEHYNGLLRFLISTGWDDGLSLEAELPYSLMPQEYLALLDK